MASTQGGGAGAGVWALAVPALKRSPALTAQAPWVLTLWQALKAVELSLALWVLAPWAPEQSLAVKTLTLLLVLALAL